MIAIITHELAYPLYEAVGETKRALSVTNSAPCRFEGGGLLIAAEVGRGDFENWIVEDIARIEATVDRALVVAKREPAQIDRVFLTGGTSPTPRIRRIFTERFGGVKIEAGGELTSIAEELALVGLEPDIAARLTAYGSAVKSDRR